MKVQQAVNCHLHNTIKQIPKKNTVKTCEFVPFRFAVQFGKRDLSSISQEEILTFLMSLTKDDGVVKTSDHVISKRDT